MTIEYPFLNKHENVKLIIQKHWITNLLILSKGLGIYLFGLLLYFLLKINSDLSFLGENIYFWFLLLLIFFLAGNLYIFYDWLDNFLDVIIITNFRLIYTEYTGLFKKDVIEIGLNKIEDAHGSTNRLGTLFNLWQIEIKTATRGKPILLTNIYKPDKIAQELIYIQQEFLYPDTLKEDANENINTSTPENISPQALTDNSLEHFFHTQFLQKNIRTLSQIGYKILQNNNLTTSKLNSTFQYNIPFQKKEYLIDQQWIQDYTTLETKNENKTETNKKDSNPGITINLKELR